MLASVGQILGAKSLLRETTSIIMRLTSSSPTSRVRNMSTKSEHSKGSDKEAAGQKGVTQEQVGGGKENDPNNFAKNPERAAAAGRKGGQQSHKSD